MLQILCGKDISYAAKAAKGELPKGGPLDLAAAHDLDVLQNLSVAESTLVAWGKDIFNTIPSGWASACEIWVQILGPQHPVSPPCCVFASQYCIISSGLYTCLDCNW